MDTGHEDQWLKGICTIQLECYHHLKLEDGWDVIKIAGICNIRYFQYSHILGCDGVFYYPSNTIELA